MRSINKCYFSLVLIIIYYVNLILVKINLGIFKTLKKMKVGMVKSETKKNFFLKRLQGRLQGKVC